ncbi:MAG: hypothetical protein ABI120_26275 [Gemmatimonadaceae bacterium]
MIFKIISIVGWICFALDTAFVFALIIIRDAGSDAAGRGLGRGWGLVLLPILLAAGGLLYWGTKNRSSFGTLTGTLLVALPFMMLANGKIKQMRESAQYYAQKAQHGQFADANLNAVAKAIDAGDTTALQALLVSYKANATALNYAERDQAGETLLGFAATRAMDYDGTPDKVSALRILLQNGVPYAADAKKVGEDWSSEALTEGPDKLLEIAAIALDAGADANQKARYDNFPIIMSYQLNVPKLELLVKHGADVHVLNERGETTLYNMVRFKKFPQALYFLQQGVDPDLAAADGSTMQSELEKGVKEYESQQRPMEPGYDEFVAALRARKQKAKP